MSIATLKKKSAAKYNNMSVSQPLFSLNGTHRNQGFVGQTSLSRSLPRTLIRNGGYRNYGGCCGSFPIGQIVQSSISTTEDTSVVKLSTKNTLGLLHVEKYQCLWRPAPYTTVKMDSNRNLNVQSSYIKNKKKKTIKEADECRVIDTDTVCNKVCQFNKPAYTTIRKVCECGITKPESDYVAMSQGEYILKLDEACTSIDDSAIAQNINNCNKCALPGNR
jgi:hypothetical protein